LDRYSSLGGGSCFDTCAFLEAGDWLHMGVNSHLNIARGITIGHEFGCGIDTKIFTHGAYINSYELGAPVQWAGVRIGDNVWMPNAWVNPGVSIGSNVLVAARSLVNCLIPPNCMVGGTPARVIKENYFPHALSLNEKKELVESILQQVMQRDSGEVSDFFTEFDPSLDLLQITSREEVTIFDLKNRTINGPVSPITIIIKDQLRRNGIRFRYAPGSENWKHW
jgi:carbonic anhydrase/acetyltransferase-like protein (isoleucine patch superfamily)